MKLHVLCIRILELFSQIDSHKIRRIVKESMKFDFSANS